MNKDQTLSQDTGRVTFKELQQIIKMGLVQGNLIPAFAGACSCNDKPFLPIVYSSNIDDDCWSTLIMGAHVR